MTRFGKRVRVDWATTPAARRGQARQLGYERATVQVEHVLQDNDLEVLEYHARDEGGFPHWAVFAGEAAKRNGLPEDVEQDFVRSYVERAHDLYALKMERLRAPARTLYGEQDIRAHVLGAFLSSLPLEARVRTYRGARLDGDDVAFVENDEEELAEVENVEPPESER